MNKKDANEYAVYLSVAMIALEQLARRGTFTGVITEGPDGKPLMLQPENVLGGVQEVIYALNDVAGVEYTRRTVRS